MYFYEALLLQNVPEIHLFGTKTSMQSLNMQMNTGGKCLTQKLKGPLRKAARLTLAAMAAAVICEEELSSVEATPLSFFSSSSSSHCTPLSSVCLWGLVVGGGERGGGGEGRSSSSSCTSFTFTMASRKRSMAWGRAGSINWKHSYAEWEEKLRWKVTCTCKYEFTL